MNLTILHLSDAHFRAVDDYALSRGDAIASATYRSLPDANLLLIVVSGDVAFSGKPREYSIARDFLLSIKDKIRQEKQIEVQFIVAPGNHDCDFAKNSKVREHVIAGLKEHGEEGIDDAVISTCTSLQTEFGRFRTDLVSLETTYTDPLLVQYTIDLPESQLLFSCINVAWMSALAERPGELLFPTDRYSRQLSKVSDLHVVVMHHPLNWYHQATYHKFRESLRSTAHLVLTGHEHTQGMFAIDDARVKESIHIEAPALQPVDQKDHSGFTIIDVNLSQHQFKATPFKWIEDRYQPTELADTWASYRKLPKKDTSFLRLRPDFVQELDDPGANYYHARKKSLCLSDIYIFPDLEEMQANEVAEKLVNSNTLEMLEGESTRILVTGEEQSGKSALIRVLFRRYHESGMYPLLVPAERIKRATAHEIDKIIDHAVAQQYSNLEAWVSLPRRQKVLLLDDLDRTVVSDRYRGRIVALLEQRFGHLLITAGAAQDVQELVSIEAAEALFGYRHLNIRPFGHKLRYDLIKRWRTLGDDDSISAAELLARIDDAEKVIDTVIGTNVIPRTPFYLLTLLQSLEDSAHPDLRASAYGYYYQYLIVRSLDRANFPADQWDELFNYCAHLAWHFHQAKSPEATETAIGEFNEAFSRDFVSIDLQRRLRLLLDAKLLRKRSDSYSFAYTYIYYYFLGMYLSQGFSVDPAIQKLVAHYSKHLYVRDYANTILFLTHHCRDPAVVDTIVNSLRSLFPDMPPLALEHDAGTFNDLVEETTRLVFHDSDPEQNREKAGELKDEMEEDREVDDRSEEATGDLDLPTQLDALFRTVDILGQVLKNYYGTLKSARKRQLMREVYEGPLRALRSLGEWVQRDKDALVKEIEAAVMQGRDSSRKAPRRFTRRVAFEFLALFAYTFLYRASNAIGSKHLIETSRALVREFPSLAYKLIGLGAVLDGANPLPIGEIKALANETEKNIFAHRLLEITVLRHLYFFKTSDKQKQELTNALGIPIRAQRSIDNKSRGSKILK